MHPPCPVPFNLAAHALQQATRLADHSALVILHDKPEVWTFARLEGAVRGCGTGLLQQGLKPGDRVLMRLGNSPAFPILFLGAIAAGLVPVPTSAALTGPEITGMADRIQPAIVVWDEGVPLPDHPAPRLAASALLAMQALPPCTYAMGPPDRLAYIVFTSGTSGRPAAVAHAHRALWARGMMRRGWEGLQPGDRLLHAGAFNWTYTLGTGLMDPWVAGATAMIPPPGVPPADLPALMARHAVTILAAAPGVYRQMLRTAFPPLPHLRHGLSAGETLSPALRESWRVTTGTDLHEALGMTECSTYLSGSPARPAPVGTVGFAQPGRRLAILDEDGKELPDGEAGILAIHRSDPGVMIGYLDQPEATAARFKGDWFLSGDQAIRRADGAFAYLGRSDDLMNAGGFRVSPLEVEAALSGFDGLTDCAVTQITLPDGPSLIACFYTSAATLDPAALNAHVSRSLARWKRPHHYQRLNVLPRTANAKLNRRALGQLFRSEPA